MSFSQDVKVEIMENKPLSQHYTKALAYGLFSHSNHFTPQEISLRTRQEEVATYFCWLSQRILSHGVTAKQSASKSSGPITYRAWISQKNEREEIIEHLEQWMKSAHLLQAQEIKQVQAFLAGAFLACGNITNPKKSYHLELVIRNKERAEFFGQVMEAHSISFRQMTRRNATVFYCKEVSAIQDLLTMMGASRASLALIEVEMIKDVRNTVNRQTNCETANISKQVSAATTQVMDIRYIERTRGLASLTATLQETAVLRLQHPDASLRELAEHSPTPVSRSGLHHRLASLTKIAEDIRQADTEHQAKEPANV